MTIATPARALLAANDTPCGTRTADLAITGLLGLLARAEAERGVRKLPANVNAEPSDACLA